MKILFVISSLNIGGSEIFVINLSHKLASMGHDVGLLVCKQAASQGINLIDATKIKLFFGQLNGKLNFISIINIRKFIKKFKPQIIISLSPDLTFLFTEIARRTALSQAPHCLGFSTLRPVSSKDKFFTRVFSYIFRLLCSNYIFVSKNQLDFFCNTYHLLREKCFLINNGVDSEFFSPYAKKKNVVFSMVHIANMRPEKDQWTLFKALSFFDREFKKWQLWFVGEDRFGFSLLKQFRQYVHESNISDKVIFAETFNRQEIKRVLSESDIFILTSVSEGLPIAALEAMAMGLPCILTDVGGCSEIIIDGYNGYLVKPQDYKDVANKLMFLCKNPDLLNQMGINARKTVLEKFSLDICAKKYSELFDVIVKKQQKKK